MALPDLRRRHQVIPLPVTGYDVVLPAWRIRRPVAFATIRLPLDAFIRRTRMPPVVAAIVVPG